MVISAGDGKVGVVVTATESPIDLVVGHEVCMCWEWL